MSNARQHRARVGLFYQSDELVCVSGQDNERLLQAGGQALFQISPSPALLLVDGANTVSAAGWGDHFLNEAFSAYGYSAISKGRPMVGFNGQWRDPVTTAYPLGNGHRLYMPSLRRFSRADSLSPFGDGGINAYCYCSGDPVNRVDPTGQYWALLGRMVTKFLSFLPGRMVNRAASVLPGHVRHVAAVETSVQGINVSASLSEHLLPRSLAPVVRDGFSRHQDVWIYKPVAGGRTMVVNYGETGLRQSVSMRLEPRGLVEGWVKDGVVVQPTGAKPASMRQAGFTLGGYKQEANGRWNFYYYIQPRSSRVG
ncbi:MULTISPECIES: RHS repeat-associated core domain-containing protein [unclassified Pseudomonas]|uniref:RHS repeat-associated core domain-containing protein n=1 Tax=unclassified Pseudomonas TaxID=196821 RepID=UPI00224B8C72|nr:MULTISPECIES: RHS repeat-associated core domain-containing protein [unclassified Pseudomonas]MCX2890880.1 RHS repeat-associated core domain-containing protein [Pseudomonas sp. DCB_BI]MDH4551602.1 RHS repeat-associated core domain-containing protein [Pseudomonas sp. BN607]